MILSTAKILEQKKTELLISCIIHMQLRLITFKIKSTFINYALITQLCFKLKIMKHKTVATLLILIIYPQDIVLHTINIFY